jgi:type II secretory pathway component GspD/PulD (secretin)
MVSLIAILTLIISADSSAQYGGAKNEPIVIQMVKLDHADAEHLVEVLKPFLSKEGRITAYGPANVLIIKDRRSIVRALVKVIKGETEKGD